MGVLIKEIERAEAVNEKVIGNKFKGATRSLDNPSFEVGDTWTFPKNYEVRSMKLGNSVVEYIFVELADGNAKKFFPSTLTKSVRVYEEGPDGMAVPVANAERVVCQGAVAELFREFATVDKGMEALKGKTVKVVGMQPVPTLNYNNGRLRNSLVPTIEFVEEKKK